MTTMTKCPECGAPLITIFQGDHTFGWKHCPECDWDERRQLREKIEDDPNP